MLDIINYQLWEHSVKKESPILRNIKTALRQVIFEWKEKHVIKSMQ